MPGFDVVVLAGGSGRRLGGVDKAGLEVGGRALLDRVLAASAGARRTVVVGPERPTVRPVTWTREDPSGGGPVAGLAAGLAALATSAGDPILVLATDLPALTSSDLDRLLARAGELESVDAVLFEDAEGHRQPLAGLYRADRLRAALAGRGPVEGASMRRLVSGLSVVTEPDAGASADCDTPEQLAAARSGTTPGSRRGRPPDIPPRVTGEGGDACPS